MILVGALFLLPFYLLWQLARLAFLVLMFTFMTIQAVFIGLGQLRRWHRARQWQKAADRYRYPLTMPDLREA
jgi:hypothetical protein